MNSLFAEESIRELISGKEVGQRVPQFFVRAVTGPHMNKSICYVCRNGDRPVAMVFLRDVVKGVPELLKKLDVCVDSHRATGLRGFCVLLSENQRAAVSKLQTLAYDHQLALPLTMASQVLESPANHNLHPEAAVTVVLYHEQRIVSTHAFRHDEITENRINAVIEQVRQLSSRGS